MTIFVPRQNLKELYGLGGRAYLVLNLAPVGCYPSFLAEIPRSSSDLDAFGCMVPYNNAVEEYNNMLKETLVQTREALPDASLVYVDTHSVLLELFRHPTSHGTIKTQGLIFLLAFNEKSVEKLCEKERRIKNKH
jgi:hypothetical protein